MSETVFEIGDQTFNVVKKGYAQAKQVTELGAWLSKYGVAAIRSMTSDGGQIVASDNFDMFARIVSVLTPESLVELFQVLLGCTHDFAMENFDIMVMVDALVGVYENQPTLQKMITRFFSSTPSTKQEADSSM